MSDYSRPLADFTSITNGVDLDSLQNEIYLNATITTLFHGLQANTDDSTGDVTFTFIFDAAISTAEETELDVVIAAHTGKAAEPSDLDKQKAESKRTVDEAAGEARERYATNAPLQDSVYIEKGKDADAFKAAGYPADETGFEFITAEKNATGKTATQACDDLIATGASWKVLAASIEELRIGYKTQIDAAADVQTALSLGLKGKALLDAI
jgi:hypothetical protein